MFLSGSRRHILITPSKSSSCFYKPSAVSLTLHLLFLLLQINRIIYHILTYQCWLIRIPFLKSQKINWDSFKFKVEASDEAKVNVINLFFIITSSSCLNTFCIKYFKLEGGVVDKVIYSCVRVLDGRVLDCKVAMHDNCFNEIQKVWLMNLAAVRMVFYIDQMWAHWTDSKAAVITALTIYVLRQMVHGSNWKTIALMKTLVTVQMDVSFIWSLFL